MGKVGTGPALREVPAKPTWLDLFFIAGEGIATRRYEFRLQEELCRRR